MPSKRMRDDFNNEQPSDYMMNKPSSLSEAPMKKRKDIGSFITDATNSITSNALSNMSSSMPKKNFIGVTYHAPSHRFRARIKIDNKTTHLGYFVTEYEAAVAYDRAAWELRGIKAHLNFGSSAINQGMQFDHTLPIRDRCVAAAKSAAGVVAPIA